MVTMKTILDGEIILRKSHFMQSIRSREGCIIWHSLFGNPKIVSEKTLDFLDLFSKPRKLNTAVDVANIKGDQIAIIKNLIDCYYLVLQGFDERKFLVEKMAERESTITNGSLITYLELIMSEACNFRCTYCVHFNNLGTSRRINNPKKFMRYEMAKEAVDQYIRILKGHKKRIARINFGGGEPLLMWSVIKQVLEYCHATYGAQFEFYFSINTNASLITQDIAEALKKHRVEIASSLDGLYEGNDCVRMTSSGSGTFSQIVRGFDKLAQIGYPLSGIAMTVNEHNFPMLDESIVDWVAKRNMSEIRIDIDVIGMVEIPVEDIIKKLMLIRQYAKSKRIDIAGFWSRPVENLNDSTLDTNVAFCGAVRGNSVCVSPSGNIYGCGYSNTQLGTLAQISTIHKPNSQYHRFVKSHLTGVARMCRGCMIEGQCGGGCNITQEFVRVAETAKFERMCGLYRRMTQELLLEQLRESNSGVSEKI